MLIVADVHGAADALAEVVTLSEPLLVLGDLVNLIDYRTSCGIVADVVGVDVVREISLLRANNKYSDAKDVWRRATEGIEGEVHDAIGDLMSREYLSVSAALDGVEAYILHGNVDRPEMLISHLPASAEYVDGETREIEGCVVGFVGGGIPRIGTQGETDPEVMREKLESLGPVDVLCTHVPPDISVLSTDVIGRTRKGSREVLDYIEKYEPEFHYFGDIHQPRATTWRVGGTTCVNVGYFRATGRVHNHG